VRIASELRRGRIDKWRLEAATFFTHDHIAVVDDSGDMPVVIVYRLK